MRRNYDLRRIESRRQTNPDYVYRFSVPGYTDLGWQLNRDNPALVRCEELEHKRRRHDNSLYINRATDVIYICDECKNFHHVDSSD